MADNETSIKKPPFYIRWFFPILVFLGCLGGFLALTVPLWKTWAATPKTNCIEFIIGWIGSLLSSFIPDHDDEKYPQGKVITDLRLHILYITGGVIAILTLLQTNWKNQVDHRKVEDDIQKNKNDHDRQVHAERRSRYTKAAEQLGDEKATVRLGGIYTLVGLVDEWLSDDTLDSEEQQKEGQIIINNLCSYIRSPFPLAEKIEEYEAHQELEDLQKLESEKLSEEKSLRLRALLKRFENPNDYEKPEDITADYAKFHEERDVRLTIFKEMSKRSSNVSVDKSEEVTVTPRAWSTFEFDFSRAPIFYPLNNLTIEQGNFGSTRFYGEADFRAAKFAKNAHFLGAEFTGAAHFLGAEFAENAHFKNAKFTRGANFTNAKFTKNADFRNAKFTGNAHFKNAKFPRGAGFSKAEFTRDANFTDTKFTGDAYFGGAKFTGKAHFTDTKFTEKAHFTDARFTRGAGFSKAKFTRYTSFEGAYFEKYAPTFAEGSGSAQFSIHVNWTDSNFSVHSRSQPIERGNATLGNKTFRIPLGTILFDPASWDKSKRQYTRVSEPAK